MSDNSERSLPPLSQGKIPRMRLPRDVARRFGGTHGFRKFHRGGLYAALNGLKIARQGSAFSGDALLLEQAMLLVEEAIEMSSVKNWGA